MAIYIYNGLPGSGKTTKLASIALGLLDRNERYFKRTGIRRLLLSNMKFSSIVENKFRGAIVYWHDVGSLIAHRDCDVVWDEVATYLDSTQWKETSLSVKRYLQQHRKYGVDIYGSTQDFPMIDIAMRRLVARAWWVRKVFGTRDKSATRPDVRNPWGLIMLREIEFDSFSSDKTEYKFKILPSFLWFGKKLVSAFDTREEIVAGDYPPLKHIERYCETCGKVHVSHV